MGNKAARPGAVERGYGVQVMGAGVRRQGLGSRIKVKGRGSCQGPGISEREWGGSKARSGVRGRGQGWGWRAGSGAGARGKGRGRVGWIPHSPICPMNSTLMPWCSSRLLGFLSARLTFPDTVSPS